MQLEYIFSGTAYMRLPHSYFYTHKENNQYVKDWIDILKARSDHKISCLYNAHTESAFPEKYKLSNINNHFDNIYADSGGLQIITKGLKISDKLKKAIFHNQAINSNYAMSFDEIPLKVLGEKSVRGDTENRIFDRDNLKEYAKKNALNFKEQIQFFLDEKSKTVPIFIIHGQTYDDIMTWTQAVVDILSEEEKQFLSTIALSSATTGEGDLIDLKKYFMFKYLPIDNVKQIHMLGVGSLKRMAPVLALNFKGMLDGVSISYDSTTHTSMPVLGRFSLNNKNHQLGKQYNKNYDKIFNEINKHNKLKYNQTEFFQSLNTSVTEFPDPHGVIQSSAGVIFACTLNFIENLEKLVKNEKELLTLYGNNSKVVDIFINDVNSIKELHEWEDEVYKFVKSKRIKSYEPSTLEF